VRTVKKTMRKYGRLLPVILLLVLVAWCPVSDAASDDQEAEAVLRAARSYLDAEVSRDYESVYTCLAPSSSYVRKHSYEDYAASARSAQDRIVDYTIVRITYIHDNENRTKWPQVEQFAQVEVDMVMLHIPSNQRSTVNMGLVFCRENGTWYKG
jgi:hypothetical protein